MLGPAIHDWRPDRGEPDSMNDFVPVDLVIMGVREPNSPFLLYRLLVTKRHDIGLSPLAGRIASRAMNDSFIVNGNGTPFDRQINHRVSSLGFNHQSVRVVTPLIFGLVFS